MAQGKGFGTLGRKKGWGMSRQKGMNKQAAVFVILDDIRYYSECLASVLVQDARYCTFYLLVCQSKVALPLIEKYLNECFEQGVTPAVRMENADFIKDEDNGKKKKTAWRVGEHIMRESIVIRCYDTQAQAMPLLKKSILEANEEYITILNGKNAYVYDHSLSSLVDYMRATDGSVQFVLSQGYVCGYDLSETVRPVFLAPLEGYLKSKDSQKAAEWIICNLNNIFFNACCKKSFFLQYEMDERFTQPRGASVLLQAYWKNIPYHYLAEPLVHYRNDGITHSMYFFDMQARLDYEQDLRLTFERDLFPYLPQAKKSWRRQIRYKYKRLVAWNGYSKLQKLLFVLANFDIVLGKRINRYKDRPHKQAASMYELVAFGLLSWGVGVFLPDWLHDGGSIVPALFAALGSLFILWGTVCGIKLIFKVKEG